MKPLTLEDLRALRERMRNEINRRENEGAAGTITIGMGTCGIAAGAKQTFDAFVDELNKAGLNEVRIRQTGCMGLCHSEPTVEVAVPGMPAVVYGRVDGAVARTIVREHLMDHKLVNDHIFDKPAADLVRTDRA